MTNNRIRMNDIEPHISKEKFATEIFPTMCIGHTYQPAIMPAVRRIIVLGDIHGDLELALNLLKIAKLIRQDGNIISWIGGSTYVVQVGDQIDRCRPISNMQCNNPMTTHNDEASDMKILKLFTDLHNQAKLVGGAVISLLGNHELLNSLGHLDYVSYKGLQEFEKYVDPANPHIKFRNGADARTHAFAPGHEIGKFLACTRYPAVIIGSNLFVHAGIVDGLIAEIGLKGIQDFETINVAIRMWLLGLLKKKYIKNIIKSSPTSMFWTRILGNIPPNVELNNPACMSHIGQVLKLFQVGSIFIGHTPQSFTYSDDINSTCGTKIWRVDNGSSSAFHRFDRDYMMNGKVKYSRRPQILEIIDDKIFNVCDNIEGINCKSSVRQ